jgi:preprotein translocase subunit SecG
MESWEEIEHQGARFYLRELAAMFLIIVLFIVIAIALSRITLKEEDALSKRSKNNSE